MASVDVLADVLKKCSLETEDENEFPELSAEAQQLLKSMRNLECPFTWKPHNETQASDYYYICNKVRDKIVEILEDEESGLLWRTFTLNLVLCYEYAHVNSIDGALSQYKKMEANVKKAKEKNSCSIAIGGLQHLVSSSHCFLLFHLKQYDAARSTFDKITLLQDMTDQEQACIWGARAAVYMEYGYEGTKKSLQYVERALKLDENQGEWWFLQGKALGRIRRIDHYADLPGEKEVDSLRKASKRSGNVSYMIFLAQVYRETSFRLYSVNKDGPVNIQAKTTCKELNERASTLYKKALSLHKSCTHVNIRCALGFIKMPYPFRDLKQASECIQYALCWAPTNAMSHHVAGKYYEHLSNVTKAKYHYQMSGQLNAFGSYMDLIRLCWKTESTYDPMKWEIIPQGFDPMPLFEEILERFKEKSYFYETCCQIGSYWYFIMNDFKKAYIWWKRVLKEHPAAHQFKNHKSLFIRMTEPVDIHDIIFDEAQLLLKKKSVPLEDHEDMEKFVKEYLKTNPKNMLISWREKILKGVAENEMKYLNANRGKYQSHSGRGNRNGRRPF